MAKSLKEFGMGKNEMANMPKESQRTVYPKQDYYNCELDDTITGIDKIVNSDIKKIKNSIKVGR